jgi:TolB-like protein
MTPDIFLSYSREDQATAQRFAEGFEAQGFSVWWDVTLRSGEAYDQVTEEALRTAKAVVVLWSKTSVVSRWVRAEATLADRNKTLVPAMIEPCDRPIMFELTQTADLTHWKGEADDKGWRAFLSDVRRFVQTQPAPNAARPAAPTKAGAEPPGAPPSLAVLPFINKSGRDEDDVFAEGMVEDLTVVLSRAPWLKVVAASATAIFPTAGRDLRQIGRDLHVRYLLEGAVRRLGEDLRVTAQLIEAESGNLLWTEKFDRSPAQLTALQEDLATEVAAHVRVQVDRAEMERALARSGDASASDAVFRGMAYGARRATRSGWAAAVGVSKQRVEVAPDDGLAHAGLAATQAQLLHYSGGDNPELVQEIVASARRALALEPDNPTALCASAAALNAVNKLQDALLLAERAIAISPEYAQARLCLGSILIKLGRPDEGLAQLDVAQRAAPNSLWLYHWAVWRTAALLQVGQPDQALAPAEQAVRLVPGGVEALTQLVLCLAKLDRWEAASDAARRLRDADPEISAADVESIVRDFYSGSGAVDDYVAMIRKAWDDTPNGIVSP